MNARRHVNSHVRMYRNVATGEFAAAQATKDGYDEHFAVLDIAAEFYFETVRAAFQENVLARGQMQHAGRPVEPAVIRRTSAGRRWDGEVYPVVRDFIAAQG